jgi:hypothetical protein
MLDSQHRVLANDFSRQWQDTSNDVMAALRRVGESGRLILAEEIAEFERELAQWWGVPYACPDSVGSIRLTNERGPVSWFGVEASGWCGHHSGRARPTRPFHPPRAFPQEVRK